MYSVHVLQMEYNENASLFLLNTRSMKVWNVTSILQI